MFSLTVFQKLILSIIDRQSFVIAYSGGLDSHVLLHAMSALKKNNPDINIKAVHINHQINPSANHWVEHCKKICDELKIPISVEKININLKPGDSLEENARNTRYEVLKKYVDENTVLLTAHNCNDQAETFLLQALRGAGSKGLSAMPVKKTFGKSFLIRPLLHFTRDDLEKYAKENHLEWIEDDSNTDPRFRRNFLRHDIFPLLKKQYPTIMNNLSRSARLISNQEKIISEIIKEDFKKIKTDDIKKINLKALREFSTEKQKLLLRQWFLQNNLRMPNEKHLNQIQKDVINAAPAAHPVFELRNMSICRDKTFLYLRSHTVTDH